MVTGKTLARVAGAPYDGILVGVSRTSLRSESIVTRGAPPPPPRRWRRVAMVAERAR